MICFRVANFYIRALVSIQASYTIRSLALSTDPCQANRTVLASLTAQVSRMEYVSRTEPVSRTEQVNRTEQVSRTELVSQMKQASPLGTTIRTGRSRATKMVNPRQRERMPGVNLFSQERQAL